MTADAPPGEPLVPPAGDEATLLDYQDVGVLLLLRKSGLHLVEVAVSMNTRQVGKSRIFYSWFSVGRYMVTTSLLCLARWNASPKSFTKRRLERPPAG